MPKLFVYGTLRKGGNANHLIEEGVLISEKVKVHGFALYDYGPYPFAVATEDISDFIIGDVYSVSQDNLNRLDEYEGEMYIRIFYKQHNLFVYIKKDNDPLFFPKVQSGDWLSYH